MRGFALAEVAIFLVLGGWRLGLAVEDVAEALVFFVSAGYGEERGGLARWLESRHGEAGVHMCDFLMSVLLGFLPSLAL